MSKKEHEERLKIIQALCPDYPNKCHICDANGKCQIPGAAETLRENGIAILTSGVWSFEDKISENPDGITVIGENIWNDDVYKTLTVDLGEQDVSELIQLAIREAQVSKMADILAQTFPGLLNHLIGYEPTPVILARALYKANFRDATILADMIFDALETHITNNDVIDWEWWDSFKKQIKEGEENGI